MTKTASPQEQKIRDPRHQGPKPEYPQPPIDSPGSIDEMRPQADHGEESYEGLARLKDRVALITGGDSGIGRAVSIAFAREGADLLISYLPEEEGDALDTAEWVKQFWSGYAVRASGAAVEIAPVYVFLASNEARYVTGEVYGVTGGKSPY